MLTITQQIRVGWAHCDPARIVYNPHFYDWMDQAAVRIFDAAGFGPARLLQEDPAAMGAPVVEAGARFLSPAHLGDVLSLRTWVTRLGKSSLGLEHRFTCGDRLVATGFSTRVWTRRRDDGSAGSTPLPDALRAALSAEQEIDAT